MREFTGFCRGGPYDGKQLAHMMTTYKVVVSPPIRYEPPDTPPRLEPFKFGHYQYVLGQWLWHDDGEGYVER